MLSLCPSWLSSVSEAGFPQQTKKFKNLQKSHNVIVSFQKMNGLFQSSLLPWFQNKSWFENYENLLGGTKK